MEEIIEPTPDSNEEEIKRGYRRVKERHPEFAQHLKHFDTFLQSIESWMYWIDTHVPDNAYASRKEIMEEYYITPQGLDLLERLKLDIYPDEIPEGTRNYYDVKKLLRCVVALPTIARLKGKKLVRQNQRITTVFKEVVDDTLNGRTNIDAISEWEPPSQ